MSPVLYFNSLPYARRKNSLHGTENLNLWIAHVKLPFYEKRSLLPNRYLIQAFSTKVYFGRIYNAAVKWAARNVFSIEFQFHYVRFCFFWNERNGIRVVALSLGAGWNLAIVHWKGFLA